MCEQGITKTSELILMQLGSSSLWGNGMKRSTFGVMRSKLTVS